MARGLVFHRQLHRDGLWRIKNFKYLIQDGSNELKEDLRIQVVIGKVEEPGARQPAHADQTVLVPIGDLPALRRNRLIRDGYLLRQYHPLVEARKESLTLDLSQENLTLFTRFHEDKSGPIIQKTKSCSEEDGETLYVGIGHNGDPYGVIIPSVDIFLFFYASSTFMTQLILSENILNPEHTIYDNEKSVRTGLHRKIWFRKGVPEQDALYLAMLLFDDYAFQAAKSIYLNRGAEGRSSNFWPIRAVPPITGKVGLELIGRDIGKNRLLVTQITSCDWVPSFVSLEWDRDGRSSTVSTGGGSQIAPIKLNDIGPPDQLTDEGVDLRKAPSEVTEPDLDLRFPGLRKVPVKRSPKPDLEATEKGRYVREVVPVKVATTVPAGAGAGKERKAEVRGKDNIPIDTPQENHQLENIQLNTNDVGNQSISTARMLFEARKHKLAKVRFISASFETKLLNVDKDNRIPLCLLPGKDNGKNKAWLYSDELKERQRIAVIAKVEFQSTVRYIFELEMRLTQKISTGLIWTESQTDVPDGLLHELLLQFADPAASDSLKQLTIQHSLQWGRCKHNHKVDIDWKHPESFAEDFLIRLFKQPPFTIRATKLRDQN